LFEKFANFSFYSGDNVDFYDEIEEDDFNKSDYRSTKERISSIEPSKLFLYKPQTFLT